MKSRARKAAQKVRDTEKASRGELTKAGKSVIANGIDPVGMPIGPGGRASAGPKLKDDTSEKPAEVVPPKPKLKAAFYIDGFNLYHGIDSLGVPYLKWLDLRALTARLIETKEEVVRILWCTAIPSDADKAKRHQAYKKALISVNVEPIEGRFVPEEIECRAACADRQTFTRKVEKEGDVNLAINAVLDGRDGLYDTCYIVTGDTDHAATINCIVQRLKKRVVIVFPPDRVHTHLLNLGGIGKRHLEGAVLDACRLPDEIILADGKRIVCPPEYIRPKGAKLPEMERSKMESRRQPRSRTEQRKEVVVERKTRKQIVLPPGFRKLR